MLSLHEKTNKCCTDSKGNTDQPGKLSLVVSELKERGLENDQS